MLSKDEVYVIIGAASEVHREQNSGFLEAVYQEALELELEERGVPSESQKTLPIVYQQRRLRREYIADVVCDDKIIVELKALDKLSSRQKAQLLNYPKATGLRVGLLINFSRDGTLEWERLIK